MRSKPIRSLALAILFWGWLGSATDSVAQRTMLMAPNHLWRYTQPTAPVLDGTEWPSPGFDDSAWATGQATFAWETTPSTIAFLQATAPTNTLLEPPEARTDYFRAHFTWSQSTAGAVLILSNVVDDGAVIYLNGVEQKRLRLPDGVPDVWGLLTTDPTPGGDVSAWEVITLGASNLVTGDNVLAVSVHQHSEITSDVVFGMIVIGIQPFAPVLADPGQPEDAVVRQEQSHVMAIVADGYPAPAYQWFFRPEGGETFDELPGGTDAAYEIAAMRSSDAGHYYCQLQNALGTIYSRTNTLAFSADETPPLLVSAVRQFNLTNIIVTFSEPMAINALSLGSYAVCTDDQFTECLGSQPTSADGQSFRFVAGSGNTQVLVGTDLPWNVEQPYVLWVAEVSDVAGNTMPAALFINITMPKLATFRQGVAGYASTVDTHLRQDQPNAAFPSNTQILVDGLGPASQGLLRFDHLFGPDAGQISFGAVIHTARLSLRTLNATRTNEWIHFHRMLQPWTDTSTWNIPSPGWLKADDVIAASAIAARIDPTELNETLTVDVTTSLQAWADGHLNYGWFLTNTTDNGYQFASSEHPTETFRPQLTVEYEEGPPVPVSIVAGPSTNTLVVNQGQPFNIAFGVGGTDLEFQWFKDNVALPGETNGTLSRAAAAVADAGDYYLHVENYQTNCVESPMIQVIVIVEPDVSGPQVLTAQARSPLAAPELRSVVLTFNEPVMPNGAQAASNYTIYPEGASVTVTAAALSNSTTVRLTLNAPLTFGTTYLVKVGPGVTDTAVAQNPASPNRTQIQQQIVLLDYTNTWRYDETRDAANNYDTSVPAWYSPEFDASSWATGEGLLARETDPGVIGSLPAPIQTALSGTDHTIYLRTIFCWPFGALPNNAGFVVNHVIDDGVICYLNGSEAFRYKMADDPAIHATQASACGEARLASTNLPAASVTASNLIACSLHPFGTNSTDAVFGLEILAQYPESVGARPDLTITGPIDDQITLTWTPNIGRLQEAASPEGPWSDVDGATNPMKIPITETTGKFYSLGQ